MGLAGAALQHVHVEPDEIVLVENPDRPAHHVPGEHDPDGVHEQIDGAPIRLYRRTLGDQLLKCRDAAEPGLVAEPVHFLVRSPCALADWCDAAVIHRNNDVMALLGAEVAVERRG